MKTSLHLFPPLTFQAFHSASYRSLEASRGCAPWAVVNKRTSGTLLREETDAGAAAAILAPWGKSDSQWRNHGLPAKFQRPFPGNFPLHPMYLQKKHPTWQISNLWQLHCTMADMFLFLEASGSWAHLITEQLSPHPQPSSLAALLSGWQAWSFFFLYVSPERHSEDFSDSLWWLCFSFSSAAFLGSKQKNFHNIMQMLWLQEALTSRMKIKLVEKSSWLVSKHHGTGVKFISQTGSGTKHIWEQASNGSHQVNAFS